MCPRSRSLTLLVTLVLLTLLAPMARAAATLTASRPLAVAGERITFDWQGLPADAYEVELELSLAGGRWVRVSPGLEPRDGRFEWTVPSGLVGDARVRLRVGGRHDEQVVAEVPLRFAAEIVLGPHVTSDDWWSVESHRAPESSFGSGAVWSPSRAPAVFTHDTSPPRDPAPTSVAVALDATSAPVAAPIRPRAFRAPRSLPLRN